MHLCAENYPPGILSEAERQELKAGLSESEISEDEDLTRDALGPLNIYQLASARFNVYVERPSLYGMRLVEHAIDIEEWMRLPESVRTQIQTELLQYHLYTEVFYPQNDEQTWILRNLTTLEYVRPEAIAITPERIKGPFIDGVGFGELVWSRICWSSDAHCAMNNKDDIHRGVWAGHRFDITTFDRHRQIEKNRDREWKDISNEAADWIHKIWSTEYGVNWRDRF